MKKSNRIVYNEVSQLEFDLRKGNETSIISVREKLQYIKSIIDVSNVANEDESPEKYGIYQNIMRRLFSRKLLLGLIAVVLLWFGFTQGDSWYNYLSCLLAGCAIGLI